jgi:Reverse transcriptase (RNA-dependent DNA polymerase)
VAQHGFRLGVSVEHAVLRALHVTRYADGPLALLGLKQAYPSVPRQELIQLVRERVNPTLADVLTVLLAPTIVETIGDPGFTTATTYRGLTQGDLKATTLFNLYIDPRLEQLDPDETMNTAIAFADDVTLVPRDKVHLERQLQICENWSWSARMTWSLTKSVIVTPRDENVEVRMCSVLLPTAHKGRLLGVQVTAGRNAEVLPDTSVERIKHTIETLHRWRKAIKLHRRYPNYAWRRAMLHKFVRPLAEFGLPLETMTPELRGHIARYDKHAAEFVLGHRTRMSTDRVQAVFRLQGGELRRRWLATILGTRIRNDLVQA